MAQQQQIFYYPANEPQGMVVIPLTQFQTPVPVQQQQQQPLIYQQQQQSPIVGLQIPVIPQVQVPVQQQATTAAKSIVPLEFSQQCDIVFNALPKMQINSQLISLANARAVWSQYTVDNKPADAELCLDHVQSLVVPRPCCMAEVAKVCNFSGDINAQGACTSNAVQGVSQTSFALGCYLLASKKVGAPALPNQCTAAEYVASGWYNSQRTAMLLGSAKEKFVKKLSMTIWVNLSLSLLSMVWWYFSLLSIFTLFVSIFIYALERKLPFLLRNRELSSSVFAFGILGCVLNIAAFGFMIGFEGWALMWGLTWLGWEAFQLIYAILSTVALIIMRKNLISLNATTPIDIPATTPPRNSKAIFISGWIVLLLMAIPCIAMTIFTFVDHCANVVTAIMIWSMLLPGGIVSTALFGVTVSRRYQRNGSICGLIVSLIAVLSSVWLAIPLLSLHCYYW